MTRQKSPARFTWALALAATLLALPLAAAHAALVTQSFSLTATADTVDGPRSSFFIGTNATGNFTYDDTFVVDGTLDLLGPTTGLEALSVTVFGATFSAVDDLGYDSFPMLRLTAGVIDALFFRFETGFNGVSFPVPLVFFVESLDQWVPATGGGFDYVGPLSIGTAPIPSTLALFALGGVGLAWRRRLLRPRSRPAGA